MSIRLITERTCIGQTGHVLWPESTHVDDAGAATGTVMLNRDESPRFSPRAAHYFARRRRDGESMAGVMMVATSWGNDCIAVSTRLGVLRNHRQRDVWRLPYAAMRHEGEERLQASESRRRGGRCKLQTCNALRAEVGRACRLQRQRVTGWATGRC
jgi:hypothetical protein